MAENVDVEQLILETRQFEFADGLREIQYGLLLGSIGLITWVGIHPEWLAYVFRLTQDFGSWAVWMAFILIWLIPIAAAFGTLALMNFARRRWLWQESGMVKASRIAVSRRVNIIAAVTLLVGLVVGFRLPPVTAVDEWYAARVLYASMGWASGVFFIAFSRDIGLRRYLWIGLIGGLASTLLLLFPLQFGEAGLVFGLGWGVMLLASGAAVLWGARKKTAGENIDG